MTMVAFLSIVVASAQSPTTSINAAISLYPRSTHPTIKPRVGLAKMRPVPLLVQDQPWEPRIDNGYPNIVVPSPSSSSWQLFYGDCVDTCSSQILLYANSTDGLTWHKPHLGLFDVGRVRKDLKHIGKANNILLQGGGVGVWRDPRTSTYIGFGPACYGNMSGDTCKLAAEPDGSFQLAGTVKDLAFSHDGLHWWGGRTISWPAPQRYDCHNNLWFDAVEGRWVATTRDGFSSAPGRAVGMAETPSAVLAFNTSAAPQLTLSGSLSHQLYSQITFRWRNIILGIVMVYDAEDPAGRVRCRLSWARTALSDWQWVEGDEKSGPELLPLGPSGAFNSHICFAANSPARWQDEERLYFMGGNGPHNGERNSSLGLATMRRDGFAGVGGVGRLELLPILITAELLTVTYDAPPDGGALRIGLADPSISIGLSLEHSIPLTTSGTDHVMSFTGGCGGPDFGAYVGSNATLAIELSGGAGGILYTVGFVPHGSDVIERKC